LGIHSDYRSTKRDGQTRHFDWGYGIETVVNTGVINQFIIPEAYAKIRFRALELYAGRRRTIAGLVDTLLTSGAYSWSGNALPIPKVQIGTIGYTPLGFTKGFVAVNAFFNHGWFNNGFVEHSYLHQKAIYFRFGKPNSRFKVYAGGNHEVQWGGYAPSLAGISSLSGQQDGRFESNLNAYYRVVSTLRGTETRPTTPGVINIDEANRIGNHLGSFDGGLEVSVGSYQLLAYRQNLYETGALYYLTNLADGLNGLRIQRQNKGTGWLSVDHLLIEFLYTKSQGGDEFVLDDPQRRGRNNYFNHSQYQDGWMYLGRAIGTPFLSPQTEVRTDLPPSRSIANNRVSLWHVGIHGYIAQRISWLAKLSYSRNYGTYDIPYPDGTNQLSALLTLNTPLNLPVLGNSMLNTSFGLDSGTLLPSSAGCFISIRKALNLKGAN
jgi:hypothetical protein